jgi:DNA-binding winged helix-turn-helix (wHTH) protein
MDLSRHEVRVRDREVYLTPKEFLLLEAMLRHRGRLLTRAFLIDSVWGPRYQGETNTLEVHVRRLRRKLEDDPGHPVHLLTERGRGYRLMADAEGSWPSRTGRAGGSRSSVLESGGRQRLNHHPVVVVGESLQCIGQWEPP